MYNVYVLIDIHFCLAGARVDIEWSPFSINNVMCVSLCLVEAVKKV